LGEDELTYRKECCRDMKKAFLPPVHPLYKVNWRGLRADALNALEGDLLAAVQTEAFNPSHVPPGELLERKIMDDFGRVKRYGLSAPSIS
jgi:hypothetical protein